MTTISGILSKLLSLPIHPFHNAELTTPLLILIFALRSSSSSTSKLRSILPGFLQPWLTSLISNPRLVGTLTACLGLDLLRRGNERCSALVRNNFKNVNFQPSKELVLVTGGSSGFGAHLVKGFATKGVKVVIIDLMPPHESFPTNVFYYESDVTSPSQIAATAAEIRRDHGSPTVLINNAGVASILSILEGTESSIRKTFEVNAISHFWMAREFVPSMIEKNHGHVVTVSSLAAYIVLARNVDYSCTKASANAFHEGLYSELRNTYDAPNVRTTLVNPSWMKTPLTEPLYTRADHKKDMMEPEIVSEAVVRQVMSGKSGHLIHPDGNDLISSIRGWPTWLQFGLLNSAGKDLDMLEHTKDDLVKHFNRV